MIEMSVAGLALDASNRTPIVLLRDPSGRRQVPIWVDHAQAHNIMAGIQQANEFAPLTHDLMMTLLKAGNLCLDRVIIHSIEENAFQAVLRLRQKGQEQAQVSKDKTPSIQVDARPSDAIALAVRTKCSIWMLEKVVAEASIPVDADADAQDQDKFRRFLDQTSPAELVRHMKKQSPLNEGTTEVDDGADSPNSSKR